MSQPDSSRKRPIEVYTRVVDGGATDAEAREHAASAADAALLVLRRDRDEGPPTYLVTSFDGAGSALPVEELFRVWVSLASAIFHTPDDSQAAQARRRFCNWTLERLGIDENLQRLARIRAQHPELSAQEAVQRMREEAGAPAST